MAQHPNSLANLQHHWLAHPKRRCAKCPTVAVNGFRVCRMHGGRKPASTPAIAAKRAANRIISAELRAGTLPVELDMQPIWQRTRTTGLLLHRPLLLAAWRSADPGAWPRAVRAAEIAAEALGR